MLLGESRRIIGRHLHVRFWFDNGLGKSIIDILNISQSAGQTFTATIAYYYQNNSWHFHGGFKERYPDICSSIRPMVVSTKPDHLLWMSLSLGDVSVKTIFVDLQGMQLLLVWP